MKILRVVLVMCTLAVAAMMADGCVPGPGCGATEQPVIIILDKA